MSQQGTPGNTHLDNCILAYNDNDNCSGVISSNSGRNIDDDDGVCFSDDDLWVDPLLAPLADNGGFTRTHLPLAGSYAIDNGDEDANVCFATDQRGWHRPIDGDGNGFASLRYRLGRADYLVLPAARPSLIRLAVQVYPDRGSLRRRQV